MVPEEHVARFAAELLGAEGQTPPPALSATDISQCCFCGTFGQLTVHSARLPFLSTVVRYGWATHKGLVAVLDVLVHERVQLLVAVAGRCVLLAECWPYLKVQSEPCG